ncbi:Hypothetical predicted protein [Pelobates cultripes]|uniref:Uncharacterized protein n=1 Tax=Pelobates cultripes TaxID=61616 RepID=A0AAD1WUJ8_PELCU|nr:Hypothetical predicted protein [Pelobates cultripes]
MDLLSEQGDSPERIIMHSAMKNGTGLLESHFEKNKQSDEIMSAGRLTIPQQTDDLHFMQAEDCMGAMQVERERNGDKSMYPITTETTIDITAALLPSGGNSSHHHARRTIVSETQPPHPKINASSPKFEDEKTGCSQSRRSNSSVFSFDDDTKSRKEFAKLTGKPDSKGSSSVSVIDINQYLIKANGERKGVRNQTVTFEDVKNEMRVNEQTEEQDDLYNFKSSHREIDDNCEIVQQIENSEDSVINEEISSTVKPVYTMNEMEGGHCGTEPAEFNTEETSLYVFMETYGSHNLPLEVYKEETCDTSMQIDMEKLMMKIHSQEPYQTTIGCEASDKIIDDQILKEDETLTTSVQQHTFEQMMEDEIPFHNRKESIQPPIQNLDHAFKGTMQKDHRNLSKKYSLDHGNEDLPNVGDSKLPLTSADNSEDNHPQVQVIQELSEAAPQKERQNPIKSFVQTDKKENAINYETLEVSDVESLETSMQCQTLVHDTQCGHHMSNKTEKCCEQAEPFKSIDHCEEKPSFFFKDTGQQTPLQTYNLTFTFETVRYEDAETNKSELSPEKGNKPGTDTQNSEPRNTDNMELHKNEVTAMIGEDVESTQFDDNAVLQCEERNVQERSRTHGPPSQCVPFTLLDKPSVQDEYGNRIKENGDSVLDEQRRIFLDSCGRGLILLDSGIALSKKKKEIDGDFALVTMRNGFKLGMKNSASSLFLYYHHGIHFYVTELFGEGWFYAKDRITQANMIVKKVPVTIDWMKIQQNFLTIPNYCGLLVPYAVIYDRNGFIYFLMEHKNVLAVGRPPVDCHFSKVELLSDVLTYLKFCWCYNLIPENIEESMLHTEEGVFFDPSGLSNSEDPCIFKKHIKQMLGLLLCGDDQVYNVYKRNKHLFTKAGLGNLWHSRCFGAHLR